MSEGDRRFFDTEAEWEWAARGGLTDQVFGWGNTWNPAKANTWQGEFPITNTAADGSATTAPVGSFPANGFGLFDMTGNVWEWTEDWYSSRPHCLEGIIRDAVTKSVPKDGLFWP